MAEPDMLESRFAALTQPAPDPLDRSTLRSNADIETINHLDGTAGLHALELEKDFGIPRSIGLVQTKKRSAADELGNVVGNLRVRQERSRHLSRDVYGRRDT